MVTCLFASQIFGCKCLTEMEELRPHASPEAGTRKCARVEGEQPSAEVHDLIEVKQCAEWYANPATAG